MKKRLIFTLAAALTTSVAVAFHVQIGFSCLDEQAQTAYNKGQLVSPSHPWIGITKELGATGERIDEYSYSNIELLVRQTHSDGSPGPMGANVSFNDKSNCRRVYVNDGSYGAWVTLAETVKVPTYGWVYEPYIYRRTMNGVLTLRGNPYSSVLNKTSEDRTVNGTLIKAGEIAALFMPIHLYTAEIPNVKFYDMETEAELSTGGYSGGAYSLGWTGNIIIDDGTTPPEPHPPVEPLLYGDIKSVNEYKLLYAENDKLIYADGKLVSTNIQLNTWWDFSHDDWGSSPMAYINDTCVCSGHSTTHIIPYTISTAGMKIYGGIGSVDFTMWQTPQSGYSGGACTMKCWDAKQGSSTSGYDNTPAEHKAASSAGTGTARFRVRVDFNNGTWTVYPL